MSENKTKDIYGKDEYSKSEIEKTCFIITPIGDPNSKLRRHIDGIIDASIIPALDKKYKPIIPHRIYDSVAITKQIYQHLYESDLVIANLTDLNPNVMYELATRFCIGKPVIIIAEEGTKLPFDVKDQRAFFYINDSQGVLELSENISKVLKVIDSSDEPSSPIYDALGEITLFKQLKSEEKGKDGISDKAISVIMEKLDSLDLKIRNIDIFSKYELSKSMKSSEFIDDVYDSLLINNYLNVLDKSVKKPSISKKDKKID